MVIKRPDVSLARADSMSKRAKARGMQRGCAATPLPRCARLTAHILQNRAKRILSARLPIEIC